MLGASIVPMANVVAAAIVLAAVLSSSAHGQAGPTDARSPEEGSSVQPAADAVFSAFDVHPS